MSEHLSRRHSKAFSVFLKRTRSMEGKITIFTSIVACFVLVSVVTLYEVNVPVASADDVSTSVTVLNTAPSWTIDAEESTESSTSTPTNAGSVLSFVGTGTDSSGDSYYLLICKTGSAPTPVNSAPPTCNGGGANQWAVSSLTASAAQATAATTTTNVAPFDNESNAWFAWICDNNATLARCNVAAKQGTGVTVSPFVINHIPVFYSISNNGPINPGGSVTWTSGSYDNDTLGSADQVRLVICRTAGFSNGNCTGGLAYATSTLAASNAASTTPFAVPQQDRFYNAFAYIVDDNNLAATSTLQGSASVFQIQNVAPSVTAATISLIDYNQSTTSTGVLTLTVPNATSGPFKVKFTVVDNNSCVNASSTNEVAANFINVYRSGITQSGCLSSGQYNSNNCYTASSTLFTPFYTCTQDAGSCSGNSDSDATVTCTFAMWYNADPTDATTQFTAENWLASVRATDDGALSIGATSSALTEQTIGAVEVSSFLAFDVSQTAVAFGSLQPGEQNDPVTATTTLFAYGNIGLDEDIYGDTMCTNWTAPDSCDAGGINTASEIAIGNQRVASTSFSTFAAATVLTSSTTPTTALINVPKTTATSSPQSRNAYFGISIPVSITLSGNYSGQDTITAKKSNPSNW